MMDREIENKRQIALNKLQASKKLKIQNQNEMARFLQHTNKYSEDAVFPKRTLQIQNQVQSNINANANTNTNAKINSPSTNVPVKQFFGLSIKGKCVLVSETRFEVDIQYHEKVIEIFRTIPNRSYNATNKNWEFAISDYELVMSKLKTLQPDICVEKLPHYVLNLFKSTSIQDNRTELNLDKIEPDLLNILMPFQREGVCFGIKHSGRCLIADDMGLGKTLQALAIASYYRQDWPLLIVTTASMKNTWEETIHKYLPSVPLHAIRYMQSSKDFINDADILIVSHDMMTRSTDKLIERGFKFIIIDESHIIKNFKAKCTKSAIQLARKMLRVILLSGTPALSRPNELYCQLTVIDEKFFGNYYEFSKRYCDGKEGRFGWDSSGKSNLAELEIILGRKFMIRRTKTEVLSSLPEKCREIIKLDVGLNRLSDMDRTHLSQLVDNYVGEKSRDKHIALLQLFAESAKIKIPSVCLYIENILESGEKFLVFAHHQVMLDAICKVLNKKRKKFIRIDGNTTSDQRKYFIDSFQLKDDYKAAVLSITAANAGITLTAAQLVLFAELHWNPSILSQAESRAHRIGQSGAVTVRYLLAEGTSDDHIWPLLQSKQNVLNEVGLCTESFRDTDVKDQIVASPCSVSSSRTVAGTEDISKFMIKEKETTTTTTEPPSPVDSLIMDETLVEFLDNENDDLFANFDI